MKNEAWIIYYSESAGYHACVPLGSKKAMNINIVGKHKTVYGTLSQAADEAARLDEEAGIPVVHRRRFIK